MGFVEIVLFLAFALCLFLALKPKNPYGPAFRFLVLLHGIYWIWVPFSDRFLGIRSFFGFALDTSPALNQSIFGLYAAGLAALAAGYGLCRSFFRKENAPVKEVRLNRSRIRKGLAGAFLFLFLATLINFSATGISLAGLLNPFNQSEHDILFSVNWAFPLVDMLGNAFPVLIFLLWWFRSREKHDFLWILALVLWFIIALLGGWRYRLILLFFLFLFPFLNRIATLGFRNLFLLTLSGGLFFAWLTLNRMAIAKRQFHLITFDFRQFDPTLFNMEFSNSRTFRASLQYLAKTGEQSPGLSAWTAYVGQRFQSRSDFPDGQKPEPWILSVTRAWIPPGWPWNPKPAVTLLEEMYLTFGLPGFGLAAFFLGAWASFLDRKRKTETGEIFSLLGTVLLFQWVSRGFFLFQLQITLVCFLPVVVLNALLPYLRHESGSDPT